jgi:hypothetical protein
MSIQIEVPFEALSRPGVASALADLVTSLGGHGVAAKPAAVAAAPAPVAAAPAPKVAKPAPRKVGRPRKNPVAPPKAAPTGTIAEQWAAYVARLPENSRRFLDLLESRNQMTVSEAVEALGLVGPKSMGGLTGAMARWSPVALPFDAHKNDEGQRFWTWRGVSN